MAISISALVLLHIVTPVRTLSGLEERVAALSAELEAAREAQAENTGKTVVVVHSRPLHIRNHGSSKQQ